MIDADALEKWSDIERVLSGLADDREAAVMDLDAIYDRQRAVWQRARDLGYHCIKIAVPSRVTRANVQAQTESRRKHEDKT